jgi:hypothetical protein
MKKIALSLLLLLSLTTVAHATDVPAYRASWTASGTNPQVTFTPAVGDSIFVFVAAADLGTNVIPGVSDNASGTYWDQYCVPSWYYTSNKKNMGFAFTRTQQISSASSTTISFDTSGKRAAAIVIAVSGLTLWDAVPKINGCGSTVNPMGITNGNVRQVKALVYCISSPPELCGTNPIVAGATPAVPRYFQQQTAFLSTSLTLAVVMTEESSPGITAPSGWTQRSTVSTTSQGKTIGLNLSTRDSGFSDITVTWGSTSPTDGTAMVIEVIPLQ